MIKSSSSNIRIAGLQKQLDQLEKCAKLCWQGKSHGCLLYGPPGTGKTLLARYISEKFNALLVCLDGGDVVSKFVGETEQRIKEAFEKCMEVEKSILFIDEIDVICPKGESSQGKRVVGQLMACMEEAKGVMVLGATNLIGEVDVALRRPGRLDREVYIGVPGKEERREILWVMLEGITGNEVTREESNEISDELHGFVGADLAGLIREACLLAVGREEEIPRLKLQDLKEARKNVRPSTLSEVQLSIPSVKWDDIGGQEEIKKRLQESVEWGLKNPEIFTKMGIRPPKGILLYGPPGCSKTMMAKALASSSGANFIAVKGPELFSKWVGDSEKAVAEVFKRARLASPCVVFFDEVDSVAGTRQGTSVQDRVLTQLLTELDGIGGLVNVTFLAATNRPDQLDSALLRPGRIDRICFVGLPDEEGRREIFLKRLKGREELIDWLARETDGYTGAECVALCQEAALITMERNIEAEIIEKQDFEKALEKVKPRTRPELLKFYDNWAKASKVRGV